MLHDNKLNNPILLKLDVNKDKINFNVTPKKNVVSFLAKEMKVLTIPAQPLWAERWRQSP